MFYPRKIFPILKKHLTEKQITVITGMRRTGKTTLLRQLLAESPLSNKLYLDLERLDNRELFLQKNYEVTLKALASRGLNPQEKMLVGLDEIQLVPEIPSVLKYLYDHHEIKFIVTGSSSYYLKNLFRESLAGRKKIFELYPLDFGEYLDFHSTPYLKEPFLRQAFDALEYERLRSFYEEYLRYGGFPEVVLATDFQVKRDLLADIISSYMSLDVKTLSDLRDEKNLYALVKALASRVGTRLDCSKLSRLIGLSRPTITSYLEFLEKTYVIARVPVFSHQADREIVKARKVYFCDNGLANLLADLGSGAQFENAVFNQLARKGELWYYAQKSGQEIDFIFEKEVALEVKETPTAFDLTSLQNLAQALGVKKCQLIGRFPSPKFTQYVWGGKIR